MKNLSYEILRTLKFDPVKFASITSYNLAPVILRQQQKDLLNFWNNNNKSISVLPRGGGKSFDLSEYALWKFYTVPAIKIAFFSRSQRQTNARLATCSDIIDQSKALRTSREFFLVDQVQKLKSHTFSEILALPYDPSTILGEHPDILLLDEIASYKDDSVYKKVLKPMLTGISAEIRIPELHMVTVPDEDEPNTFFPEMFKNPKKYGMVTMHRNWMQCEGYDPVQVQKDRIEMGETYYLSQLMCALLPPGSAPFPWELILKNLVDAVEFNQNVPCSGGVDQAKKRDKAAICIVQPIGQKIKVLQLFECQYDYSLLARKCQTFHNDLLTSSFLVDTTTGDQFVDFGEKPPYSLPLRGFSFGGNGRRSLIDFLHIQMEQGNLMIPPYLQSLQTDLRKFRKIDHMPDSVAALCLAVWNLKRFSQPSSRYIASR